MEVRTIAKVVYFSATYCFYLQSNNPQVSVLFLSSKQQSPSIRIVFIFKATKIFFCFLITITKNTSLFSFTKLGYSLAHIILILPLYMNVQHVSLCLYCHVFLAKNYYSHHIFHQSSKNLSNRWEQCKMIRNNRL